jgi:hypothetical protein
MQQFTVKLDVRDRGTYLSAVCADVPGLHLVDSTREGLRHRAMKAVPLLLKKNRQLEVQKVAPTDDLSELRITVA